METRSKNILTIFLDPGQNDMTDHGPDEKNAESMGGKATRGLAGTREGGTSGEKGASPSKKAKKSPEGKSAKKNKQAFLLAESGADFR